jgi:hypothetical protein
LPQHGISLLPNVDEERYARPISISDHDFNDMKQPQIARRFFFSEKNETLRRLLRRALNAYGRIAVTRSTFHRCDA